MPGLETFYVAGVGLDGHVVRWRGERSRVLDWHRKKAVSRTLRTVSHERLSKKEKRSHLYQEICTPKAAIAVEGGSWGKDGSFARTRTSDFAPHLPAPRDRLHPRHASDHQDHRQALRGAVSPAVIVLPPAPASPMAHRPDSRRVGASPSGSPSDRVSDGSPGQGTPWHRCKTWQRWLWLARRRRPGCPVSRGWIWRGAASEDWLKTWHTSRCCVLKDFVHGIPLGARD